MDANEAVSLNRFSVGDWVRGRGRDRFLGKVVGITLKSNRIHVVWFDVIDEEFWKDGRPSNYHRSYAREALTVVTPSQKDVIAWITTEISK